MRLDTPELPPDSPEQRKADKHRLRRAFNLSLGFVLLLCVVFGLQHVMDLRAWSVAPGTPAGLLGLLGAPLLHGSFEHLAANAIALLMLGSLALTVYPRATLRALPLLWLGSGLGAWLLGEPGSHHLGASGLTHGLMFVVFTLGLLRRDRAAIAAGMLAFLFYGGMLLTILPQEPGVSWQSHMGGALAGIVSAFLFKRADPIPPRKKYSWELEDEQDAALARQAQDERDQFEPERPQEVPVLWNRPARAPADGGVVLHLRRPPPEDA